MISQNADDKYDKKPIIISIVQRILYSHLKNIAVMLTAAMDYMHVLIMCQSRRNTNVVHLLGSKFWDFTQGRRQGKSLEGAKLPRGSRGQCPLVGVQGAEPLGGGQGAEPPEADTFLVLKSW